MITAMLCLYKEFGVAADKRTIPNSIDCLRNVERRLLLVLNNLNKTNKLLKSARVVGECLGRYHPHGDMSIYGVLQQLVNNNYVFGKGGWGNIGRLKDDKAADFRYTECKLNQWIRDLAFDYIDYAPKSEIIVLDDEEPKYLPSPIPIGLIGNGLITGIGGFYSTLIPKYKIEDLTTRLFWILDNKDIIFDKTKLTNDKIENEKLFGPCIIPYATNCMVNESNNGEFYNILYNGSGTLLYSPVGNIIKYDKKVAPHGQIITVNGRAPNSTYRQLIEATIKSDTEEPKLKCDVIDGSLKDDEILRIIPRKNDKSIESYAQEIWENYLTKKIEIAVNICDENDEIKLKGIDYILYNSYSHWKKCVLTQLITDLRKNMSNLFKSTIIMNIIAPIFKSNSITTKEELLSIYKEVIKEKQEYKEIKLVDFDEINNTFIEYTKLVEEKDILEIIAEKRILSLIESKINISNLMQTINNIISNITNFDDFCLNYIKTVTKGI